MEYFLKIHGVLASKVIWCSSRDLWEVKLPRSSFSGTVLWLTPLLLTDSYLLFLHFPEEIISQVQGKLWLQIIPTTQRWNSSLSCSLSFDGGPAFFSSCRNLFGLLWPFVPIGKGDSSWSVPTATFPLFLRPFDAVILSLFSTVYRFNFLAVHILSQVANEAVSGTLLVFFYHYLHILFFFLHSK